MKKKPKLDPNSNLMRSELMWEQPKKKTKFYKNWKLYAIALPVAAVVAGTGSGVYLGVNGSHKKTDLNKLDFVKTVQGTTGMNAQAALEAFLSANQEKYPDLGNKVTYKKDPNSFSAPAYVTDGQLTVIPAKKSNYSGQIVVTISQIGQFDLTTLDQSTLTFDNLTPQTINEDLVFDAFVNKQQNQDQVLSDLRDSVTLKFTRPTYNTSSSLVITPNNGDKGKYKNSITIPIAKFQRKSLADLLSSPIDGINTMVDSRSTLKAFLVISGNEKYRNFIQTEEEGFKAPSATEEGSLKIGVNSASDDQPYSGDVMITIDKLTDLNGLNFITSLSSPVTEEAEALKAFINANHANPKADKLKSDVEIQEFKASNYQNDSGEGSFKIVPKSGTEYDVNLPLEIVTGSLSKTNWDNLPLVKTVPSNTTKETALQAFLDANEADYPDLADNVELVDNSFTLPGWGTKTGSYKIKAIDGDHKYEGNPLEISVQGKEPIALSSLKNDALLGSEVEEDVALQAFLTNNSISDSPAEFKKFVDVEFNPPKFVENGMLKISALLNSDNKYSGEIDVVVKKIGQTNWDNLPLVKTVPSNTTKDTALQAFLDANEADYPDLADNVELVDNSFTSPGWGTETGSYKIKAIDDMKYFGENLTITIESLPQKDISSLYSEKEIHGNLGKKDTPEDELKRIALDGFMEKNSSHREEIGRNIKITEIKDSSYIKDGYFKISASTPEYKGEDTITIVSPGQKSLEKDLDLLVKTVPSNTTKETALQAFLDANKNSYSDLEGNVELDESSFVEPTTTAQGSYTIKAKEGGEYKYKDSVKVTFPAKKVYLL